MAAAASVQFVLAGLFCDIDAGIAAHAVKPALIAGEQIGVNDENVVVFLGFAHGDDAVHLDVKLFGGIGRCGQFADGPWVNDLDITFGHFQFSAKIGIWGDPQQFLAGLFMVAG